MKKIFTIILIFTASLLIVSCGKEVSQSKPVFYGVDDIEIVLGTPFNPMFDVYVEDETDGLITDTIIVDGKVNINEAGDYVLTYSVTNSLKVSAEATRKVTVVEVTDTTEIGGITNGDFSDGLEGWRTWADTAGGYVVDYSAKDNQAVIDIQENSNDDQWWGVQLAFQKINLAAFGSYKLEFTVSSENPRYLNYQIGGDSTFGEKNLVLLSSEPQNISKEFTANREIVNGELQFAMGNFKESSYGDKANLDADLASVTGKVYISNVRIIAGPRLENQAPSIIASDYHSVVGEHFLHTFGLTLNDDRDKFTGKDLVIENITEGLEKDDIYVDTSKAGTYRFKYTITDSEGLSDTKERTIVVKELLFFPGFKGHTELTVPNGWEVWAEENHGGMDVVFDKDGQITIDINKIGEEGEIFFNKIAAQNLAFAARNGKYEFTFKAKADIARKMAVIFEGSIEDKVKEFVSLGTDWVEYTITIDVTNPAEFFHTSLNFWFGTYSKEEGFTVTEDILTTVYIKDLELKLA